MQLIFFKTALFSTQHTHAGTKQGTPPHATPSSSASSLQGWKGYWWARKKFEFAFFCVFLLEMEMSWSFEQIAMFQFWEKVMLLLNIFCANFTKWSNTPKKFVVNLPTNCLTVFDHFVGLVFKGLTHSVL